MGNDLAGQQVINEVELMSTADMCIDITSEISLTCDITRAITKHIEECTEPLVKLGNTFLAHSYDVS